MAGKCRFEKLLIPGLGLAAAVILAVSCYSVMLAGPLSPALKDRYTVYMMAETVCVFLWNLLWLSMTGKRRFQAAGVAAGIAAFTWCHQIFLPVIVSGLYMALLVEMGRWALGLFFRDVKLPLAEELSMALTLGSGLWLTAVCLVSLTGHGGLNLWRYLAGFFAAVSVAGELWIWKRNKGRLRRDGLRGKIALWRKSGAGGNLGTWDGTEDRKNPEGSGKGLSAGNIFDKIWLPEKKREAWLLAFIITMALIQVGRMNIELDYDSLHYGLRSAFVLDNGKGIYENLGMINLVYTYSKGLETLLLPLSGTPSYGFVLAFSLWVAVGVLLLIYHMVSIHRGRRWGILAAALAAAVPGIMNMTATAKSDMITLLHQLIIYNFLSRAFLRGGKEESAPWLLMAVSTYLLTLVYKPTALVFSTALGGVALICLAFTRKLFLGRSRDWLLLLIPGCAAAGLWRRTWLLTGVPVTSIFAGFFEKIGFQVNYPFSFTHVIGDPSALTMGEKLSRLSARLVEMLLAPVSEDMGHVIIAWGSGLITFLLIVWVWAAWRADMKGEVKALNLFDRALLPVLALACVASIYTLSQVDGNYFILFYALVIVSSLRMMETGRADAGGISEAGKALEKMLYLLLVPFLICSVPLTCATGWAGTPGFTPVRLKHKGYFDHREAAAQRRVTEGSSQLALGFSPRTRVLAFGTHPQVLDLPCSVQSYYDVTGSGGNVYLVKKLAYFEEFLQYAGTEYFFVEAGYLGNQPRALQIVEDMIAEGSLRDIRYEWGNMVARVSLDGSEPENPEQAVARFHENYIMYPSR